MNPIKFYGSRITSLGNQTNGFLLSTDDRAGNSNWIMADTAAARAVKMLCGTTATTGDYSTLSIRAKSAGANTTGGVIAGNFSASATINNYANLYGVQAYVQPATYTNNNASGILCALYGKTVTQGAYSGRIWSAWVDCGDTVLASASHYLMRLSHNGGAINLNGIFTLYQGQGCDYLFNFENNNAPLAGSDKTGGTKDMAIACYANGKRYWIQMYQS
jgi:hypothetical protein